MDYQFGQCFSNTVITVTKVFQKYVGEPQYKHIHRQFHSACVIPLEEVDRRMDQELPRPRKRNHGNKDIAQHDRHFKSYEINMRIAVFVQLYKRCFSPGGKNWFAIEQK